ncbi:MAG: phosphocholine cytidylyltransferase family protein [Planctomycetota bacterium]|nr:phosphocholine cytidylyltransferase family protein [Planctomycetota bacterium]
MQIEHSMRRRRDSYASAAMHVPGIAGDSPASQGETSLHAVRPGSLGDRLDLDTEEAEAALVDAVISVRGPRCGEESRASGESQDADDGPITTALLLAAGAGTRLQPLTDGCPKCLTEVHGVPILGRLLSCLVEQGFERLVVVVGYRGEQIRDYLESNDSGLAIRFVDCPEYATTNNIYSLWMARRCIRESFVLIESDLLFDSRLLGLMRVRNRVAVARFQPGLIGTTVSIDRSGRVKEFHVGVSLDTPNLAQKTVNLYSLSAGAWREVVRRLERRIAAGRVHDYYEVVFAEMVAEGLLALQAVSFDAGRWCEIDTLEDLRVAEQLFQKSRRATWPRTTNRTFSTGGSS